MQHRQKEAILKINIIRLPRFLNLCHVLRMRNTVTVVNRAFLVVKLAQFLCYGSFCLTLKDSSLQVYFSVSSASARKDKNSNTLWFLVKLFLCPAKKGLTNCSCSFSLLNATLLAVYRILFARKSKIKTRRQMKMFRNPIR